MKKALIKEFYRTIHLDDLTLAYSGSFSDTMTERIIELSEAYLESNEQLGNLKRRTSFLVAECFQNVVRHSVKDEPGSLQNSMKESFFLRFYENRCFIASENLLPLDQVEPLRAKLELVNNYDKKDLRKFYRSILDDGEYSDEGGAGLGLIEMARKTGNKLLYSFEEGNDGYSLFYLMLVLENTEEGENEGDYSKELSEIKTVIKHIQEDNMFLLYKGSFEEEIIQYIEQIIEGNLDSTDGSLAMKVKLYHASIAMMHKIGQYSYVQNGSSNGMLFLGLSDIGYIVNATFPVNKTTKDLIEEIFENISHLSDEELDRIYQEKLKAATTDSKRPPGIGFMQLARISKSWDYEFDSPDRLPQELVYQVHI